jgi:ubiquitin fusion degradation protein 1
MGDEVDKIVEHKYFMKEYLCYSFAASGRAYNSKYEYSDKIVLPQSALMILSKFREFGETPVTFRLNKSGSQESIYSSVLEFSAESRKMYVPKWMMDAMFIEEGQRVSVTSVEIPKGEYIKLKPRSEKFLKFQNPKNILELSLREYGTLYNGQTITINYIKREWEFDVVGTMPYDVICITNTNLILDFVTDDDKKIVGEQTSHQDTKKLDPNPSLIPVNKQNVTKQTHNVSYWDSLNGGNTIK